MQAITGNAIAAGACLGLTAMAYLTATAAEAEKEKKKQEEKGAKLGKEFGQRIEESALPLAKASPIVVNESANDFNFHGWISSLKSPLPADFAELLRCLDDEVPSKADLALITDELLQSFGMKTLRRVRLLSAIQALTSSQGNGITLRLPKIDTTGNQPLSFDVLSSKQDLGDITDWDGLRVLMRVDYNVPIKDGVVTDDKRIVETLPTIQYILGPDSRGTPKCIILICHLGQPAGNFKREKYSLLPVLQVLRDALPNTPVEFVDACVGTVVEEAIAKAKPGSVLLCQNLRFHPEEAGIRVDPVTGASEECSPESVAEFGRQLSALGDVFVFEAFGVSHRKQCSVTGITIKQRVAGLLMQKELQFYSKVLNNPARPFLAIVGGAKVSDKIKVLENMMGICDEIIIGGGMAYTFKKVLEGMNIGSSIFDEEGAKLVGKIMKAARDNRVQVHFPTDHIIADSFSAEARYGETNDELGVPNGWMALDIGPLSRTRFGTVIRRAKTVLWNGPLGVFEMGAFAAGTLSAMVHMCHASHTGTVTVIGGGDTGAASAKFYYGDKPIGEQMSHVSTGGGSSLVLMEGKMLPAVPALTDKVQTESDHLESK